MIVAVLLVVAAICFAVVFLGVGGLPLLALGLAFWCVAEIVERVR